MKHYFAAIAMYGVWVLCAPPAAAQEAQRVGSREIIQVGVKDLELSDTPTGHSGKISFSRGNKSGFMRLQFDRVRLNAGEKLVIGDWRGSSVQEITGPADIEAPFISNVVFGDNVTVRLDSEKTIAPDELAIGGLYSEYETSPPLSIFGKDERAFVSVDDTDGKLFSIARSVVFISFVENGDFKVCTGWVLSDDTIMTNQHCVANQAVCDTTAVVFDYMLDQTGLPSAGETRRCAKVEKQDYQLDWSILKIDGSVPDGVTPLKLRDKLPPVSTPVVLIQHPAGEAKQISSVGCTVLGSPVEGRIDPQKPNQILLTDFTHRCDTLGGSSGSPVVAEDTTSSGPSRYCVVGLHHFPFQDGGQFESKNRAVSIEEIIPSLKANNINYTKCEE